MFAMLWNWYHKFFGTNESGVYLAVRILFRGYEAIGEPSSFLALAGRFMLKYTVLRLPSSMADSGIPWSPSSAVESPRPSKPSELVVLSLGDRL